MVLPRAWKIASVGSCRPARGRGAGERGLRRRRLAAHPHRDALPARLRHLAGHGALPDQLVETQLVGFELALELARRLEHARRADRLVRLLRVLHLGLVLARLRGEVLLAVLRLDGVADVPDRRIGERGRVGAHVGDVPVLVEPLRDLHGAPRAEAQLAVGLLLQRRGGERRRRVGGVRLRLDRVDLELTGAQALDQRARLVLEQEPRCLGVDRLVAVRSRADAGLELAGGGVEVAAGDQPLARERHQLGVERLAGLGGEGRAQVPERRAHETLALARALDHQFHGDRLHATGREARADLAPQDGRDLVAVEAVEEAAGLLRLDQPLVELARIGERGPDRFARDLVEDQAALRDLRFEHLHQVPTDRLAFAVFVGGEIEDVGFVERLFELRDLFLLFGGNDVHRGEVVFDVDPEPRPGLALLLGRDLGRRVREIADVADRRLDLEAFR